MNPRMARLPQWKGIPLPFFITYRTDGTPDFKVVSEAARIRCANERLCWICGEQLGYWIVFIGGPKSVEERLFTDPAVHEECAIDAFELCPFIAGRSGFAKWVDPSRYTGPLRIEDRIDEQPPEKMARYRTRGFQIKRIQDSWFFKPDVAKAIEWVARQ